MIPEEMKFAFNPQFDLKEMFGLKEALKNFFMMVHIKYVTTVV